EATYRLLSFDLREGGELTPRVLVQRDDGWLHRPLPSPDGRYIAVGMMLFAGDAYLVDLPTGDASSPPPR
ncbi:MAG: hypothetical protein AAFU79_33280, partial [Myxococcota bacterium]